MRIRKYPDKDKKTSNKILLFLMNLMLDIDYN